MLATPRASPKPHPLSGMCRAVLQISFWTLLQNISPKSFCLTNGIAKYKGKGNGSAGLWEALCFATLPRLAFEKEGDKSEKTATFGNQHFYKSSVLHQPQIAFLCAIIMKKNSCCCGTHTLVYHFPLWDRREIVEDVKIRQRMSVAQVMQATESLICCFI